MTQTAGGYCRHHEHTYGNDGCELCAAERLYYASLDENWVDPNVARAEAAEARAEAAERELGLMTAAYESQTLNLENAKDVEADYRAEVKRLRTVQQWQPIESAPKDGTIILLYSTYYGVLAGTWSRDAWRTTSGFLLDDVTSWMPLPPPPPAP